MAIRSDVTVEWRSSPRVITVPDPSTNISVQDLYDTLSSLEAEQENLQWDRIVSAGGKESLGGGSLVAVTVTLLNAQITWGDRASPVVTRITGGNIVAVDDLGDDIDVLLFSANVNCFIAQSSSATVNDQALQKETRYLIESLRDGHYGWGHSYYWDPIHGSDSNDGMLPETAFLTFAYAQTQADSEDIIYCIGDPDGSTVITEYINVTKDGLIIRSIPGRVRITCPDGVTDSVTINAHNVEFSGFTITAVGATERAAIRVKNKDHFLLRNCNLRYGPGNGIVFEGGNYHKIDRTIIHGYTVNGITMTNVTHAHITSTRILHNDQWGVELINTGAAGSCRFTQFSDVVFNKNVTGAIKIGADVTHTTVQSSCTISDSNTISVQDAGTGTFIQTTAEVDDVWDHSKALTVGRFIALK